MLNPNEPESFLPQPERRLTRLSGKLVPSVDLSGNPRPWERLPGEPLRWFMAFERYLRLPSHQRTIRRAATDEQLANYQIALAAWHMESVKAKAAGLPIPPEPRKPEARRIRIHSGGSIRSWEKYSTIFAWNERAQAHDAFLYAEEMAEYDELRKTSKRKRRETLMGLLDVGAKALQPYLDAPDPPKINLKDLVTLVTKATQELRAEFNDEPVTKIETTDSMAMSLDRILASARAKMREDGESLDEDLALDDSNTIEGEYSDVEDRNETD